jgi:hypothetical protein
MMAAPARQLLALQCACHITITTRASTAFSAATPISNVPDKLLSAPRQVDDLYSYFRFLRYSPYNRPPAFKALIKDRISSSAATGYKLLQVVLQVGCTQRWHPLLRPTANTSDHTT